MTSTVVPTTPDQPRPELIATLPALRARLEEQRQFRVDQLARLSGGYTEHPGFDEHPDVRAELTRAAEHALADIETALSRMHTGRYGLCLDCAGRIPLERLQAIPEVGLCADCHRRDEHRP
jgi:DnaK suppressor protein